MKGVELMEDLLSKMIKRMAAALLSQKKVP